MGTSTATKALARTATEIGKLFPLGDEAKRLLRDGLTVRQYLDVLVERHLSVDAVRFLAHALPRREGVWWACLCARGATGNGSPALQAAERWVADPSEANRRAAQAAAVDAGPGTPAGCAALAAFWSGGSLAPANVPAVPPGETLTAQGVAGAILLAAVATEPHRAPDRYREFLSRGLEVLGGSSRWKDVTHPLAR